MRTFLKYEFKNNWKDFLVSFILMICSYIVLSIFILCTRYLVTANTFVTVVLSNIILLVVGSMVASLVLFIINMVKSLYTSIFTDEGYLTLSFPKSVDALLISKILSQIIWACLYGLCFLFGFGIVLLAANGSQIDIFEGLRELIRELPDIMKVLPFYFITGVLGFILNIIVLLLSFSLINMGTTTKHKMLLGLLIFIGFNQGLSIIGSFLQFIPVGLALNNASDLVFTYGAIFTEHNQVNNILMYVFDFTTFIYMTGLIIGGYFIIRHILTKKLELE